MPKSDLPNPDLFSEDVIGRSYYLFLLEQAGISITQARALVAGNPVDSNHELELIQRLIADAYEVA